ncbi:MAG: hypothetical protein JEY94_13665 [Melioribacteraceae bacterium]|nr:hypothetical protein [Melioribacteraceae bacterium]
MNKRTQIILLIATSFALLCSFYLPIEVPYTISGIAKILPNKQLILSRGSDGDILTNTVNHISGVNNSYQLTSFERGESMLLNLTPTLRNGQIVEKGDTLGVIYSSRQQEALIELNGELGILKATLKSNMSGEKKTEVKEAEERMEMAKSEYHKQSQIVERLNALMQRDLIAKEEYQTASDELIVLSKAINVRKAELESCLSGVKAEEINTLKKQINAIENKISFLNKKAAKQNSITAPFSGRIDRSFSNDTLFTLSNFDSGIAFIPVPLKEASYIETNELVSFELTNTNSALSGTVQTKQPVMQFIGGKQCLIILAQIDNLSNNFISGIIAQAQIQCEPVQLDTFIIRTIFN